MDKDTLKIINFIKLLDQVKNIERKPYVTGNKRLENDAEHSWHLAMIIILIKDELPKDINYSKLLELALTHDIIELYAGDTFAFDEEARKTKQDREDKSAKKMFSQLPNKLEEKFNNLYLEYRNQKTEEAKIVSSIDKIQPMIQNILTDFIPWRENNISIRKMEEIKKGKVEHNEFIYSLYLKILEEIKEKYKP